MASMTRQSDAQGSGGECVQQIDITPILTLTVAIVGDKWHTSIRWDPRASQELRFQALVYAQNDLRKASGGKFLLYTGPEAVEAPKPS